MYFCTPSVFLAYSLVQASLSMCYQNILTLYMSRKYSLVTVRVAVLLVVDPPELLAVHVNFIMVI